MPRHFMTPLSHCLTFAVATLAVLVVSNVALAADISWRQWRGDSQNGVAPGDRYPQQWSEEKGVAWKIELPGRGGSTPVLDSSAAYLTSGVEGKNTLLAVDLSSGNINWKTELGNDTGNKHKKGSGSNPSAVLDDDSIFAYFRSGDLACVEKTGDVRWHKNLQKMFGEDTLWWDLGSSPIVTENAVVVTVMQSGPSYLVAFDRKSGEQLWKTDRMLDAPEEAAQSYATPLAVAVNGEDAIAVMGADHLTLHRMKDGKEIGRLGGFNPKQDRFFRSISSPVAQGNMIVCPYARGETLTAVDMDALANGKGKAAVVWERDFGSDVPTPAAVDGRVYVVSDKDPRGLISCLDIKTGETIWSLQVPKSRIGFSSSPLLAGNHLYVTQENAVTYVIGPLDSAKPSLVATNKVDDDEQFTVASPVPAGDSLLMRTRSHLYRLTAQ